MVKIGNFFFKNRNFIFIFFYLAIFIPFWKIFTAENMGIYYYWWPIITGLFITVFGQMIRGMTIGLAYIIRGGKDGKVFAEDLVTQGIFNHCRNPLYVGNILMLTGVGVLSNSLLYVAVMLPIFLFIYHAIVLAEENFLRNKFGHSYVEYCKRVSRWFINPVGIVKTFASMKFNWRRYILKEYNTICVWLIGIVLILLFKYPELTNNDTNRRNLLAIIIVPAILVAYLFTRYLKKSGTVKAD